MVKRSDIQPVMVTVDRSPSPNYLRETVGNLLRGGMTERVLVADSGSPLCFFTEAIAAYGVNEWYIDIPSVRRTPNQNVARALRLGAESGKPWVLFLEDDIDVCRDFMGSTTRWLTKYHKECYRVFALGANYFFPEYGACRYPIDAFYGTQAFLIRSADALVLSKFLEERTFTGDYQVGAGYDIYMHYWMREAYPHLDHFLVAVPALVQHIGHTSVIEPRSNVHTFPSWKGREWSFQG